MKTLDKLLVGEDLTKEEIEKGLGLRYVSDFADLSIYKKSGNMYLIEKHNGVYRLYLPIWKRNMNKC